LLALEAAVEAQVAGVLEVRHLERHRMAVLAIAGAEDGRHPAARDDGQQLVLIERLARRRLPHRGGLSGSAAEPPPGSSGGGRAANEGPSLNAKVAGAAPPPPPPPPAPARTPGR